MTQAFSLYTELSVMQNLILHAKLYHISKDMAEKRAEELMQKFSFSQYRNTPSLDLPLGIKQRLSLAVAVIHKPEMLILDEPTSGVDPVSRDVFWELLVNLSRNDKVTIFVSTHFMNEGERCDRISLMHQGRVLDCDKPSELIRKRGKSTLEEAFIDYLKETEKETPSVQDADIAVIPDCTEKKACGSSFFSLQRLLGYAYKESLELLRDPVRMTFAIAGMAILMFIMGYGISMDFENMSFAVLDEDNSPESRSYVQNISGSRYFSEHAPLRSFNAIDQRMKTGELNFAVLIPPEFGKNLLKGHYTEVGLWIDGAMPFRAETIRGYVRGMHLKYIQQMYRDTSEKETSLGPVNIELRYKYNPDFKSIYAMVPAVIPMLLIFIPPILMALSVVREKELGSITNFYATPVTRMEFIIGKQLPYVVISMVSFLGLVVLAVYIFGVPLKGSMFLLSMGALLYVTVTTGMGLLMSTFTSTQIAALAGTALLTLIPAINYSGLKDPVSSMEGAGAFMGKIYPTTYFIIISRGIFSKALQFSNLYREYMILSVSVVVITLLCLFMLKKQER
jgi:ribosome-dependent ATPase